MPETSTSLAELKANASPPMKPGDDATEIGFFNGPAFALTYRVASVFAQSTLVPKHYQNNPGNCMIALNMAQRLGCDPLMAMQNLYVVHGTPAWSAQFLIATFNKCGRFSSLRYEFIGEEGDDSWGCRAVAVELSTGEKLEGPLITIALAKKEQWYGKTGSKWQTMPEQMLRYRAAAWFVRAYAPEIAMGLHMAEEMLDAKANEFGVYETVGPATITTAEIKGGEVIEAAPQPVEEPKANGKKKAAEVQAEAPPADDKAPDADISHETLKAIEAELSRLGVPDRLPPDIVGEYGTADPSELTEPQGRQALIYLKGLKV